MTLLNSANNKNKALSMHLYLFPSLSDVPPLPRADIPPFTRFILICISTSSIVCVVQGYLFIPTMERRRNLILDGTKCLNPDMQSS